MIRDMIHTREGHIPIPILSMICMAVIIAFAHILPIAFEREERRQQIVQQVHCEQYGPTIAKWAEEKGIENPCDKPTTETEKD